MVRDTVDLYGGLLEVHESPLGGARFTLRLPGR
jgi:signal transduction histidine kinase